jgi:S-adenosylmethionine hydrolase
VIDAHVLYRDRFGNLGLDLNHDDLPGSGLRIGQTVTLVARGCRETARFVRTFAEAAPGELIVYEDAYRRLAVAVSHGDGAERLGLAPGHELRIEPA